MKTITRMSFIKKERRGSLYTAKNQKGVLVHIHDSHSRQYWVKKRLEEAFFCQSCKQEVVLRLGAKRRWHFAHRTLSTCKGSSTNESLLHQKGKEILHAFFLHTFPKTSMEHYLPQTKQRPDIHVQTAKKGIAIEYQCSTISTEDMITRNNAYRSLNIVPLWILGAQRLKRKHAAQFRLQEFEFYAIYLYNHSRYLYYFDPIQKVFCFLSNVFSLHGNLILANCDFIRINQLTPQRLFSPPWRPATSLNSEYVRYRQKAATQMMLSYPFLLPYYQQMRLDRIPSLIGWTLPAQVYVAAPPHVWQTFFIFDLLEHFPLQKPFSFTTINQRLTTLGKHFQWGLRAQCSYKRVVPTLVVQYLELLISFRYLEKLPDSPLVCKRVYSAKETPDSETILVQKWSEQNKKREMYLS
ncbi:competence protein CoiA [Shouchella lehensis]|uniref:Competence protein/transcription factor n=1 Tax=Shouchella lehensis G1 TaxID=1246626 RepID=A0A060M3I1_9BACI|nr:competence protein CoiA family protein [Shouchella lehensis]AIC95088.1 competence protein/transcription factor [Shouchella lehensis G1]